MTNISARGGVMSDHEDTIRRLTENAGHLRNLLVYGCHDGNCRMVKRHRGQVTNGGCKCIGNLAFLALATASDAERLGRQFHPPILEGMKT